MFPFAAPLQVLVLGQLYLLRIVFSFIFTHSSSQPELPFDWLIPNEWNITDCFIEHIDSGQRFLRFSESNLHVVGYSHPMDCVMDYNDLKDKIYTLDGQPDLIPYITSYYSYDWGFCSVMRLRKASPGLI